MQKLLYSLIRNLKEQTLVREDWVGRITGGSVVVPAAVPGS